MDAKQGKDMAWYSKIGAAVKDKVQGKDQGCVLPEIVGNVPDDPRQWRGFELAEAMEQGLGPGLSLLHIEPPPETAMKEERLVVVRAQNRSSYKLQDEAGKTVMIAKPSADGLRFELHVGHEETQRPAFLLSAASSARNDWDLTSVRCEECELRGKRQCGRRSLMRLTHYVESVGEGQAFCMDVELPCKLEDGSRAVLCDCCGDASASWSVELTARRPKWNPKHKSLTLDFHGRCSMASAKNFQLEDAERPGKYMFLFGKVAENRFTLDHKYPLGAVQAFAISLSASHWK